MTPEILAMLAGWGMPGLLAGIIVWDRMDRRSYERERSEADKALAASLSALTVTIQHLDRAR